MGGLVAHEQRKLPLLGLRLAGGVFEIKAHVLQQERALAEPVVLSHRWGWRVDARRGGR